MATAEWVTVKQKWCERLGSPARLLERRVYPSEQMPDLLGYRVTASKCDSGVQCNQLGFRCRWAFTQPDFDPFSGG